MAFYNDPSTVFIPPPLDTDNGKPPPHYHVDREPFILTLMTAFTTTACPP